MPVALLVNRDLDVIMLEIFVIVSIGGRECAFGPVAFTEGQGTNVAIYNCNKIIVCQDTVSLCHPSTSFVTYQSVVWVPKRRLPSTIHTPEATREDPNQVRAPFQAESLVGFSVGSKELAETTGLPVENFKELHLNPTEPETGWKDLEE